MRSLRAILVVVLSGLAVVAGPAAASDQIPFTATLDLGVPGSPERTWQSGPILHVRGEPNDGVVTGGLNGPASIVNNYNLDLRTTHGTNWGTFVIASGGTTWEGTFRGTIRDGVNDGTFVGHGTDGSLLQGSFSQIGEFLFVLEGAIKA